MRQFMVRTVSGPVDPQMLLAHLWPGPQLSRMLTYSVVVHLCLATTFMIFRAVGFSFKKIPAVVYNVNLMEARRPKPVNKPAKTVAPKPKPKPKPQEVKPKPKPKPKPEVKKKAPPPEEKKVEIPKVVKPPAPKEKPPEVKPEPEPPKKEPPPPEPEPVKLAKAPEPEPETTSSVEIDTDYITPDLKWYIEMIRRKIWQSWIEPRHALTAGAYARVVIRFEIGRGGNFALQPMILEPSNNSFFDQSGYRAVVRSAPFPPLPESYTDDSLGVQFGFEYGERT